MSSSSMIVSRLTLAAALVGAVIGAGCGDDDRGRTDSGPPDRDGGPVRDGGHLLDGCIPIVEICGDRVDQNCDGRDQGCGDNDGDRYDACRAGEAPPACDCDDNFANVYPGHTEECDGLDNDCNGRVDETAECCAGCGGMDRTRADICLEDGTCDCSSLDGVGPCPEGLRCCSTGCVDVASDATHCGLCEQPCAPQGDTCTSGMCGCGSGSSCAFTGRCTAGSCG